MSPNDDATTDGPEIADELALARRVAEARPEGDRLTRSVWFARVASALFGEAEPVMVGRYRLERQLGRGGGGSVYVARDPELHREVAVKLIRCTSERHRRNALAEARALAKLSHPNVVAVHDVGETADHVYLVMELLRGGSLREHAALPECRVRDLVSAYRQAASGLAAAHAIGLVHRDFKPDNAVFGDDGRLRVVDFGLAVGDGDDAVLPAGTPRYMAPEQRAGAAQTAAVDQYAVGVALREAMTQGGRAEPAWLGRVTARATAERPEARYPSMEALSRALGQDPRTRWTRRALLAAPVVLAIASFGIGRASSVRLDATCGGGAAALAPAWTPERARAVAAHIEELGTAFAAAAAPQVRDRARKLGEDWIAAHRASCTAHAHGELSGELHDRAAVCLARSRAGIAETMALLETSDVTQLAKAIAALAAAGGAEQCADPVALATETGSLATAELRALDQQIEAAAVHARAATGRAVGLAERAVGAARASGDPRLLARALLVLGHAHMPGELEDAIPPLHEAMRLALASGQDELMTEAYARHAFSRAHTMDGDPLRALDGLELAEIIGLRSRERGAFARALLANNVGAIAELAGDFARARERFRRAWTEAKAVRGPGAVELATTVSNLAKLTADRAERARLFAEALAAVTAAVGPDHPDTLWKQLQAVADRDDAQAVVAELVALCPRAARLHPTLTLLIDVCGFELAWQATAIGRGAHALEAMRLIPPGQRGLPQRLIEVYAGLAEGRAERERIGELESLAEAEAGKIERLGWSQNVYAANVELAVAATARLAGDAARAERVAARAIDHLERVIATTGVTAGLVQRRLAWARALRSGLWVPRQ
jgi:hypothetical protein